MRRTRRRAGRRQDKGGAARESAGVWSEATGIAARHRRGQPNAAHSWLRMEKRDSPSGPLRAARERDLRSRQRSPDLLAERGRAPSIVIRSDREKSSLPKTRVSNDLSSELFPSAGTKSCGQKPRIVAGGAEDSGPNGASTLGSVYPHLELAQTNVRAQADS